MTDISKWAALIHQAKSVDGSEYVMVPLNWYQMGNLLDALTQAQDTGDWHHELQDIIGVSMTKFDIKELSSNRGKKFTRAQVCWRNIK